MRFISSTRKKVYNIFRIHDLRTPPRAWPTRVAVRVCEIGVGGIASDRFTHNLDQPREDFRPDLQLFLEFLRDCVISQDLASFHNFFRLSRVRSYERTAVREDSRIIVFSLHDIRSSRAEALEWSLRLSRGDGRLGEHN